MVAHLGMNSDGKMVAAMVRKKVAQLALLMANVSVVCWDREMVQQSVECLENK